jgi:signal transduction histidine kinase
LGKLTLLAGFILAILFLYRRKQIAYLKELESIRSDYEKAMLNTQLEIQEQTFQHISREIHDHICLNLTLAKLNLVTLKPTDWQQNIDRIDSSIDLLSKSIHELSDISHSMNPGLIESFGLIKTLEIEIEKLRKPGLFNIAFELEGNSVFMNSQKELFIFRIIQEAFNNVIKHADAKNVLLRLYYNANYMETIIQDDGIGFSSDLLNGDGNMKHQSGLVNIKKRAKLINGNCKITSQVRKGTTIYLSIPY